MAPESFVPVGLALVTWLIRWDVDPLQEVGTGLGQEDDGLGCFELGKEQPVLTSLTPPVIKQLQCRSRDPGPALPTPLLDTLPDQIDQRQLDPLAASLMLALGQWGLGITVECPSIVTETAADSIQRFNDTGNCAFANNATQFP